MTTNIYVLKLEGDNWYIGKSDKDAEERIQQHFSGTGSVWTKLFRPIAVEVVYKGASPFDEDRITKEYMAKYGIEKVRGGSYVTEVLSEETIAAIQREIWGAQDVCLRCGRKGHFVTKCYAKTDVNGKKLDEEKTCTRCGRDAHDAEECEYKTTITGKRISDFGTPSDKHCTRCGRDTHTVDKCRCKTTVDGKRLDDEEAAPICTRCGRDTHTVDKCYAKTTVDGKRLEEEAVLLCTRCGRDTHTVDKCYAKTTVIRAVEEKGPVNPMEENGGRSKTTASDGCVIS